ncbi:hypothetical protein O9H85_26425 [Paenibacillus filicis]|uniref:ParA family protein n=1 Tax=Paenibacillus gyeongsangnamensis TaxID=3388067 RepID=A0ABT4QG59_9BACL|nr:hypothetical protein [Paenibacillus filicis]MCZ8515869.1 hypothetical protein [Paenibacillus filicis]
MAKISVVLLEEDRYFGDMMSAFLRASEYGERFTLRVFTCARHGSQYVEQLSEPFVLVVHESMMPLAEAAYRIKPGCIVILSDASLSEGILEYPVLCKFQPLDRLLSRVLAHFNEFAAVVPLTGRRETSICTVYSASGGIGKTITSVHLARQLAIRGERVLCLCLELLPSREWYASDDDGAPEAFSQLLYYAKTNPKLIGIKKDSLKRKHAHLKFDYIPPFATGSELWEMNGGELRQLLSGLSGTGDYDRIVVDLDSAPLPCRTELFRHSDQILWLITDDSVHLAKAREQLHLLSAEQEADPRQLLRKMTFIHNKSMGQPLNDWSGYGLSVQAKLSYVPEWKAVRKTSEMFSPAFAEQAASVIHAKEVPAGVDR